MNTVIPITRHDITIQCSVQCRVQHHEHAWPPWEGEGRHQEGHDERVDEPVLLQELVQLLVPPHPQHVASAVCSSAVCSTAVCSRPPECLQIHKLNWRPMWGSEDENIQYFEMKKVKTYQSSSSLVSVIALGVQYRESV